MGVCVEDCRVGSVAEELGVGWGVSRGLARVKEG